ncbi:hypothetical protein BSR29_03640 [Boudabousia liubingyangii]|uniref:YbjN domain-containing protein n=1 Tax=Boudabousia liubingyangii TaxID=1921764 RepID=A0A1Q5PN13_9ACTO|nr:YbjN domain-containing protein [Boudabousia liubingyangii]OKL47520.1 hypothetical protein BSR28_03210 [Boudabousia liubingyangii]OKL48944.1 hypothetical protein BSR29_03640 [Boudabousia liubingyangii]
MSQEVTTARIEALLLDQGYRVSHEDAQTLIGTWNHVQVLFHTSDDWLSVYTLWDATEMPALALASPHDCQAALLFMCEQFNRQQPAPRAYPLVADGVVVKADVVFSIRRGMSDEQLRPALSFALTACVDAPARLAQCLPPII